MMNKVPEYFYKQSAVIPYKFENNRLQILLITSRKNKNWIIPKGVIEPGTTERDSAKREALEEAGIIGEVSRQKVGAFKFKKWDGICNVEVYSIKVENLLDEWEEDWRERKWFEGSEVSKAVKKKKIRNILKLFIENN